MLSEQRSSIELMPYPVVRHASGSATLGISSTEHYQYYQWHSSSVIIPRLHRCTCITRGGKGKTVSAARLIPTSRVKDTFATWRRRPKTAAAPQRLLVRTAAPGSHGRRTFKMQTILNYSELVQLCRALITLRWHLVRSQARNGPKPNKLCRAT